jgi:hypothetical protein
MDHGLCDYAAKGLLAYQHALESALVGIGALELVRQRADGQKGAVLLGVRPHLGRHLVVPEGPSHNINIRVNINTQHQRNINTTSTHNINTQHQHTTSTQHQHNITQHQSTHNINNTYYY